MRVLCIGDSIPLPRKGCDYIDTWFYKLKSKYPSVEFICDFKGARLVEDTWHVWCSYFQYCHPNIVIIQEGVCDSSPRYINENHFFWKFVISLFAAIRITRLFWAIVKLRKRRKTCTFSSLSNFSNHYNMMVAHMIKSGVKYIVFIKIGHGAPSVVKKSAHFNTNADRYNLVFEDLKKKYYENVIIVDPLNQVDDDLFVDGYHCNAKGMDAIFQDLNTALNPLLI